MSKFFKALVIIVILGIVGGYFYWQYNKKHIIKTSIEDAIAKKTDSLYYIHYDSSNIDEVNGDASFYNVSLQSDSAQKKILDNANDLPDALFIIKVNEVKATGIDIAGLLQNENVTAKKILLNKPYVQIINTGKDSSQEFTHDDTLALYKKILGRFKTISADSIEVTNGTVLITDREGKALTTLENININLGKFIVDSTHDYQNIASYFIKNVHAEVENIQLPESKNKTRINIEKFVYDAGNRYLEIKNIKQYKTGNTRPLIDLKNIRADNLNTNAFILSQRLQAGMIQCDGGIITIYKRDSTHKQKDKVIQFSSDVIDEAQVQGIKLGNTKIVIINPVKPDEEPFVINNVTFNMPQALNVSEGSTLNDMILKAKWQLSVGDLSLITKNKVYKIGISNIHLDNKNLSASIGSITVKPIMSEEQVNKIIPYQHDRYDLTFNNIKLQGISFEKILMDNSFEANLVTLQPIIKVSNDRTLPPSTAYKNYPHQKIQGINMPIFLNKIQIINGIVAYTETAAKSEMKGAVTFTNVNGTISNITNIKSKITTNNITRVNASALFLGVGKLTTQWNLALNDSNFTASGTLGAFHAADLNKLIEPLAMASVKQGEINKLVFNIAGNNHDAKGNTALLYKDLKIELLKKNSDNELQTKGLATFLANTIVKNNNPQNGNTRTGAIDYNRETNKSFFNLLWKSIFSGVKKIVM